MAGDHANEEVGNLASVHVDDDGATKVMMIELMVMRTLTVILTMLLATLAMTM